jgi:predicted MFS family arabinose efflux permease
MLTTEFMIVGLLPAIAHDLHVSVSQAGLLMTMFAFTVAATGPFLTAFFIRFERKTTFVGCMALLGLANTLAALTPNMGVMIIARLLPALTLPVFWSLANVTAVDLSSPERAGRAISLVTMGIVCATVFGIPLGTLIAESFGWRSAFGVLAALAFAKAVMLHRCFPVTHAKVVERGLSTQIRILRDPHILAHVILTIALFTAMFTAYTYLADILGTVAAFSGKVVGWTLMAFGAMGLAGNWLGGRTVDWNPLGASLIFSLLMAASMLALMPSMHTYWTLAIALGIWGITQAAMFVVCTVRLLKAAPQAPGLAASLNISASNVGIGLGAILGGRIIEGLGIEQIGNGGAAVIGVALVLTLAMMRQSARVASRC